ncbi:MAG: oligosaccharide flippase family protein [Burkholderiales bacterium]|nr:oligosaccharide flippase family protein [Burkholderiales bacterium]
MKNKSIKNITYSYGSVIITSLLGFITLPLSLNYFGKDLFGLFSITGDTLAYLALFNFGIPWAAATIFAKLNSHSEQRRVILKALSLLSIFSLLMIIFLFIMHLLLPNWVHFISNISASITPTAKLFISISIIFFIARLPFSLFSQLLIFINHAYIAKVIDVFSAVLNFICLLTVIYFKLTIVQYALISGVISLVPLIFSVMIFLKIWKSISSAQSLAAEDKVVSYRHLLESSFYFFLNSIGTLLVWNTDSLVISHYLGLGETAEYAVMFKFFTILFMIISQLMNVINPLYPKLMKEGRQEELTKLFNMTVKLFPIIGGILFLVLFGVFKDFVVLWTHNDKVFIGYLSCFAMGLYCYFLCSSVVPYSVLMSLNYSKEICLLTLCDAVLNLCLSVYLVTKIGVAGVVIATLIAHVLILFILVPIKLNKLIPNLFKFDYFYVIKHLCFVILPSGVLIYFLNNYSLNWFKIVALISIFLFYSLMSLVVLGARDIKNIKYELMSKFMATKH